MEETDKMPEQKTAETKTEMKPEAKAKTKKPLHRTCMIICLLLLVAGAGAYWWRDKAAKQDKKDGEAKISALQTKIDELEAEPEATEDTTTTTTKTTTTSVEPTAAAIENIIASITSDNTAALQGYMASTISVIIAASEGVGDRTPTQAISDLAYLDSATDPWDFSLSAATLTDYQTGDYKAYFKTNSVVGKSANDYVISFNFNSSGKINGIFMAVNADLL